ncbi:MAG: hypothetical protein ACTSX4_12000 [Candidatus Helarchaeota archaeon]
MNEHENTWRDLLNSYFIGRSIEQFKEQFPVIETYLDPWKDLYYLFELIQNALGEDPPKKVSNLSILQYFLTKYGMKYYLELYGLKDHNYAPALWSAFPLTGMQAMNVLILRDLLHVMKRIKQYQNKIGEEKNISIHEFYVFFNYLRYNERYFLELVKLDKRARQMIDIHENIRNISEYKKEISVRMDLTYPTVRKYLKILEKNYFRFTCIYQHERLGLSRYSLTCVPPLYIHTKNLFLINSVLKKSPTELQSAADFLATDRSSQVIRNKIMRETPIKELKLYKKHELHLEHVKSHRFSPSDSEMHFTKNGDIKLDEHHLQETFDKIVEKYEQMIDSETKFKLLEVPKLPQNKITRELLRFIWGHQYQPNMLGKHFEAYTGIKKNMRKQFRDEQVNNFTYTPIFSSLGMVGGQYYCIYFERNDFLLDWQVNFVVDVFKTFPFKAFYVMTPLSTNGYHSVLTYLGLPRPNVSALYRYINHVESEFPMRFKFEIMPIVYVENVLSVPLETFFDVESQEVKINAGDIKAVPVGKLNVV